MRCPPSKWEPTTDANIAQNVGSVEGGRSRDALEREYLQLQEEVEELTIRAPITGLVQTEDLNHWQGRYVQRGTKLASLVDPSQWEVSALLTPSQAEVLKQQPKTATIFSCGDLAIEALCCDLVSIEPNTSTILRHPALTTLGGGDLTVRSAANSSNASEPWELLNPATEARFRIETISKFSPARSRGKISLAGNSETIGKRLASAISSAFGDGSKRR